jgi:hypothetical protein
MRAAFQQVVLISGHRRKMLLAGLNIDVACRAGAATAAHGEQLIKAGVPDDLNNAFADARFELMRDSVSRDNGQPRHQAAAL